MRKGIDSRPMSQTTDLIRQLRQLPMSQSEISRRTGIPQPRISKWEADGAPQSADDALKLEGLLRQVKAKKPKQQKDA